MAGRLAVGTKAQQRHRGHVRRPNYQLLDMLLSPVDTVVFSWFKDQLDDPTKGQVPPMQMV